MSRHRSLALGFGACLALGMIDLVALNVWLAPAAWPPSIEGSRVPPSRAAPDSSAVAVVPPAAAPPDAPAAARAPDIAVAAPAASPDAAVAAAGPDGAPVVPRRVLRTRRLFFATASSALSAGAITKLRRVVQELRRFPSLTVRLDGHTDQRGREGFNDQLSLQRAEVVATYLQQRGISRRRIGTKGHGATRPLSTEDTPTAWQRNRRVEIRIRKGTGKP